MACVAALISPISLDRIKPDSECDCIASVLIFLISLLVISVPYWWS